ncbi:MAG: hypothetical protein ACJ795_08675, partial [Ktedonobacteraceae bacterium]
MQSDDPTQYLASLSYDTYDGRGWSSSPTFSTGTQANEVIPSESAVVHTDVQHVHVVNPPGEQYQYLFGASQFASVNQPIVVVRSAKDDSVIAILSKNGKLTAGANYTIT